MDKETLLRKQVHAEVQSQFDSKLQEAKRGKIQAEEEFESAAERWRSERRRLNLEIDRLESSLVAAKEKQDKNSAELKAGIDPVEVAKMRAAGDEKLNKATKEWETERTRLRTQIERLEQSVADAIERSNNSLRTTLPVKQQFEAKLEEATRARLQLEDDFRRAQTEWAEEKLRMTGEMVKLRRYTPSGLSQPKAVEAKDSLKKHFASDGGNENSDDDQRLSELQDKFNQASSRFKGEREQMQKEIQRLQQSLDQTRTNAEAYAGQVSEYELKMKQISEAKAAVEEELRSARTEWSNSHRQLSSEIERLESAVTDAMSAANHSAGVPPHVEDQIGLLESQLADAVRSKTRLEDQVGAAKIQWMEERARQQTKIKQLEITLSETRERMSTEIVDQLRKQYDEKVQEIIDQKTQLTEELQTASNMLETERARFTAEMAKTRKTGKASPASTETLHDESVAGEIARVESIISQVSNLIDNPTTELSTVIRKNVEKAELDAYLKGILFSLGRGKGFK